MVVKQVCTVIRPKSPILRARLSGFTSECCLLNRQTAAPLHHRRPRCCFPHEYRKRKRLQCTSEKSGSQIKIKQQHPFLPLLISHLHSSIQVSSHYSCLFLTLPFLHRLQLLLFDHFIRSSELFVLVLFVCPPAVLPSAKQR